MVSGLDCSIFIRRSGVILVSCPDLYSPAAEERSGDNGTRCPTFEGRDVVQ